MFNLVEANKVAHEATRMGIYNVLAKNSPVLEYLFFLTVPGDVYSYNMKYGTSGAKNRDYNENLYESNMVLKKVYEYLKIIQSKAKIDRALLETRTNKQEFIGSITEDKVVAQAWEFTRQFFLGDPDNAVVGSAESKDFKGLKPRLTGSQLITKTQYDYMSLVELETAVVGANKVIFTGRAGLLELNNIAKDHITKDYDAFGRAVYHFGTTPVRVVDSIVVEKQDPLNPDEFIEETIEILGSDFYCVAFGQTEKDVIGLLTPSGIQSFGPTQNTDGSVVFDIEAITAIAMIGPRSAARLTKVTEPVEG